MKKVLPLFKKTFEEYGANPGSKGKQLQMKYFLPSRRNKTLCVQYF